MRTWQVERRKRTRHLIELGGLVVKAGIVDLTDGGRRGDPTYRSAARHRAATPRKDKAAE